MARKNQNADNFFRHKLSGYEVPEKKGNWEVLNRMLDARERRRKLFRRMLFLSSFLMVTLLSVLIFMPADKKRSNHNAADGNSAITASHAPGSVNNNPVTTSPSEKNLNEKAQDTQNKTEVINKNTDKVKNVPAKDLAGNHPAKNSNTKVTEKRKKNYSNAALKQNEQHPSPGKIIAGNTRKKNEKKEDVIPENGKEIAEKNLKAPDVVPGNESKDTATSSVLPVQASVIDSSAKDSPLTKAPAKDSLVNSSFKDTSKFSGSSSRFFGINLFAGVNLYRTQNSSLADDRNISLLTGAEIMHTLSKHFEVGLSVAYSLQGGYHLSDTATRVSYFLEENVSQQVILIRKQHRLYVPLTLYYVISAKHAVSAGIHWSYLVNTVGDFTESNSIDGTTSSSQKNDVRGYMDGINSSSYSFAIGYRYSLSKNFDINMRFLQEVGDQYTPQYFNGVNTAPSWSLQTFISIKF